MGNYSNKVSIFNMLQILIKSNETREVADCLTQTRIFQHLITVNMKLSTQELINNGKKCVSMASVD